RSGNATPGNFFEQQLINQLFRGMFNHLIFSVLHKLPAAVKGTSSSAYHGRFGRFSRVGLSRS
ncbi:MAG: hypothetical protein BRC38_16415, partial [Cyanobacteria bacterium QH_6_48_35]